MERIVIEENGLYLVYEITDDKECRLLHFGAQPLREEDLDSVEGRAAFYPVEVMVTGLNRERELHGVKVAESSPGFRLKYVSRTDERDSSGRKLVWHLLDQPTGLAVNLHMRFFDGIPAVQCWTEVTNTGTESLGLEYVSSFVLSGIEKEGFSLPEDKLEILVGHNAWMKELSFSTYSLRDFGLVSSQMTMPRRSSQIVSFSNTGNWSTKENLPMGVIHNQETDHSLFFQIEHNGSWNFEISDARDHLYLALAGPDELHSHWWKELRPGDSFVSVPAGVGAVNGGLNEAGAALTRYRRAIRRENEDNRWLPVIFNDYMNCLFADPTTQKELPMIDKAALAGCEYYVIDAGWYADGHWWDSVGEYQPSRTRFPDGLPALLAYIRSKGMIPGLWLEIEVMGIHCPKAESAKDDCFFIRHGKRVAYRSRWQLDFRNPWVIRHATEVVDRLAGEYGVGYIKMDYNIEPGIGTEIDADSCGDGLLGHNRAYLAWLEGCFSKYPGLVIENCSSGGMRMDYAMLSRHSIQSTSDIEDYRYYATIAANAPMALTPEQAAVWSYPLVSGDGEETVYNMVNALLLRIHQSGHLVNLDQARYDLVTEAILFYKSYREEIPQALPFWPLGLSEYQDSWVSLGLRFSDRDLIAVWRRGASEKSRILPVDHRRGQAMTVVCVYPANAPCSCCWNASAGSLSVSLPGEYTARIFELKR